MKLRHLVLSLAALLAAPYALSAPGACSGKAPSGELTATRIAAANSMRSEPGLYEGPVWIKDALYFSDFTFGPGFPSRIRKLDAAGNVSTAIEDSGSNGLAVDADGNLWMAGRYAVGLQPWNPVPGHTLTQQGEYDEWVSGSFKFAFTTDTIDHGLGYANGPTYEPAGYQENNRGAAVTPDGRLWLARDVLAGSRGGLVSWDPKSTNYTTIQSYPQVPTDLVDVQADPDGTLWIVELTGALLRFDPATGVVSTFAGVSGVTRISIDATVTPRAIYASMAGGLAVIRAK